MRLRHGFSILGSVTSAFTNAVGPVALLAAALSVAACQRGGPAASSTEGVSADAAAGGLCVAVRGNGLKVLTHLHSLARLTEDYGEPRAVSGASSGAVTTFLYESIVANPELSSCASGPCTPDERAARVALLLKSLHGYLSDVDLPVSSAHALRALLTVPGLLGLDAPTPAGATSSSTWRQILSPEHQGTVRSLLSLPERLREITEALRTSGLSEYLNPELLTGLSAAVHAHDLHAFEQQVSLIQASFANFGNVVPTLSPADAELLFLRPGVLSYQTLASRLGEVADFYAGRNLGPDYTAAYSQFLNSCAAPSRGLAWPDVARLSPNGFTCRDLFAAVISALPADKGEPSRLDDGLGEAGLTATGQPLSVLIMSTVLSGTDAANRFAAASHDVQTTGATSIRFNADDLHFGYWGLTTDLHQISDHFAPLAAAGRLDEKSRRYLPLGTSTWRQVLGWSPAEPSSAAMQLLTPQTLAEGPLVSAGGWSDELAAQELRGLGCDTVALVTRPGDEAMPKTLVSGLSRDAAQSDALYHAVFDFTLPTSGDSQALAASDIVNCSDWDNPRYGQTDPSGLIAAGLDAYQAPLVIIDRGDAAKAKRLLGLAGSLAAKPGSIGMGCEPVAGSGAVVAQ